MRVLPKKNPKQKLDKMTLAKIRNLARRGSDLELDNFFHAVAMGYIADVRGEDYVNDYDYVNVKDFDYEMVCPCCGATLTLDLKEVANGTEHGEQ